jgi:hypothetical protein
MKYLRFLLYVALVSLAGAYLLAIVAHALHCALDGRWLKCPYEMMGTKDVLFRALPLFCLMTFLLVISILGARRK